MNQQIVLERLKSFEGCVPFMYRCTGGAVTAGVGHALLTLANAVGLDWQISGHSAAESEIAGDFGKVAAAAIGLRAVDYEHLTGCRLTDEYIVSLADDDIARFESALQAQFPQWSAYPESAQEGLFDMAFNLGIAGLRKFPQFLAAVEARDWEDAAAQCHRVGVSEDRNQQVAALFRQAGNP
jgi:GH24 family phage-related lysozyme (muramidase)